MGYLRNTLQKLRRAGRNRRTGTTARKRHENRLGVERLEERALLASWVGQIGGAGADYVPLGPGAMDASGNVYLTGQFSNTVDFDFGSGVANLTSAGVQDGFAAKYASDGSLLWARRFGGTSVDAPKSLVLDPTGSNVYVTGSYQGSSDFTGDGQADASSLGSNDAFVLKLDGATGTTTWFKSFGGTGDDSGNDIAVADGFVYVGGTFANTVDFNPGAGTFNLTASGKGKTRAGDAFVQKLDLNGNFATAWSFGGAPELGTSLGDSVESLIVEGGNVFVVGKFVFTADFDPGPAVQNRTAVGGWWDAFIASYSTSGAFQWVQTIGGTAGEGSDWQIASAGTGLLITGNFARTIDADPGPASLILNSGSDLTDAFVGKYAKTNGSLLWAQSYGTPSSHESASVQPFVDPATGNLYIGGGFYGTVDFNPLASGGELVSAGDQDGFLLKLDASGNYLNAWRMGGTSIDGAIRPIGLLGSTIYSAGWFSSPTADFPTGGTLTTAGSRDVFLMAIDQPTGSPLLAASAPAVSMKQTLTLRQAQPLLAEALARWQAAGADASSLQGIDVRIADLGGTTLGLASGDTIWLDDNAAGWGWFVDATPWDDSEFTTPGDQGEQNRMDLLTVVMHELGHLLGYEHSEAGASATPDVMAETLAAGVRPGVLNPELAAEIDALFAQSVDHRADAWLGAWLAEHLDSTRPSAKKRR